MTPSGPKSRSDDYLRAQLARADTRIGELEDSLETALERVLILEKMLDPAPDQGAVYSAVFGLTRTEARIFDLLMRRERAATEQIEGFLYGSRCRNASDGRIVQVFLHRIRKKILPRGIALGLLWGQGYFFSPAMKALVQKRVQEWDDAGQPIKSYNKREQSAQAHV